ncbi:hypothetical protein HYQ59_1870 [Lactobacillus crispatus]|uniref:hypothetical protein n=1 Tax=Lactobacillus crispatus TaxID=47770 RepID=UPI0018E3D0BC|nr:hypothetical protein [Lactobacillus crispatus]MBI1700518.1 hypothetical protein [Lactobacillus crispatus]
MNKDNKQYFDDSKFLQFSIFKIMLCVMILTILILPFIAIECILYLTFRFYSVLLLKLILFLFLFEVAIGINLLMSKRKAEKNNIDYIGTLKATWLLIKMLNVAVDSSQYNYSANHQREIIQNILRFSSYVLIFQKQMACIFIAEPLSSDFQRNSENLNQISSTIARYLQLTNSNFKNEIWRVKRFGIMRVEKYNTQILYY